MENFSQQYPCNPLWTQLNDLYGALGTPARVCHTVIAGESNKSSQIEATLNFLSYFLRSGLVKKREETRCSGQEDVQEACAILERHFRNNPSLRIPLRRAKKVEDEIDTSLNSLSKSASQEEIIKETSKVETNKMPENNKLKGISTMHKSIADLGLSKSGFENNLEDDKQISSKVKIAVSSEDKEKKESPPTTSNDSPEKTILTPVLTEKKTPLKRQKNSVFDGLGSNSKTL